MPRAPSSSCYEAMSDPPCYARPTYNERNPMPTFEFSDDFDAAGWYMEQMEKGSFDEDYFDYWEE